MRYFIRLTAFFVSASILIGTAFLTIFAKAETLEGYSTTVTIKKGEQKNLNEYIRHSRSLDDFTWTLSGMLTWTSSNPEIVAVTGDGTATGLRNGTARITASGTDNTGVHQIQTVVVRVQALESTPAENSFVITEGKMLDMQALLYPDFKGDGTDGTLAWATANSDVVMINADGLATTMAVGNTFVTATRTYVDGTVEEQKVRFKTTSKLLEDKNQSVTICIEEGRSVDLIRMYYPNYAGGSIARDMTVTTYDSQVVSVSGGTITGVSSGSSRVILSWKKSHDETRTQIITVAVSPKS